MQLCLTNFSAQPFLLQIENIKIEEIYSWGFDPNFIRITSIFFSFLSDLFLLHYCLTMSERIHVVIVDDHTLLREGLEGILKQDPENRFLVTGMFNHGQELIDALPQIKCDVALLDVQMPVKGGESTLEHLKNFFPEIQSLMISSSDQEYQVEACVKLGAKGFLPKRINQFDFKKAILLANKGEYFFNELLTQERLEEYQSKRKPSNVLTLQECRIIQLISEGLSTDEIAARLNLSRNTIKTHRERALKKTGTSNSMELYHFAVANGFIKHFPK